MQLAVQHYTILECKIKINYAPIFTWPQKLKLTRAYYACAILYNDVICDLLIFGSQSSSWREMTVSSMEWVWLRGTQYFDVCVFKLPTGSRRLEFSWLPTLASKIITKPPEKWVPFVYLYALLSCLCVWPIYRPVANHRRANSQLYASHALIGRHSSLCKAILAFPWAKS